MARALQVGELTAHEASFEMRLTAAGAHFPSSDKALQAHKDAVLEQTAGILYRKFGPLGVMSTGLLLLAGFVLTGLYIDTLTVYRDLAIVCLMFALVIALGT